jgi:hypothetical protein
MIASISAVLPREPASQIGLNGPYSWPTSMLSPSSSTSATNRSWRNRIMGALALPAITVGTTTRIHAAAKWVVDAAVRSTLTLTPPQRYFSSLSTPASFRTYWRAVYPARAYGHPKAPLENENESLRSPTLARRTTLLYNALPRRLLALPQPRRGARRRQPRCRPHHGCAQRCAGL